MSTTIVADCRDTRPLLEARVADKARKLATYRSTISVDVVWLLVVSGLCYASQERLLPEDIASVSAGGFDAVHLMRCAHRGGSTTMECFPISADIST